MGSCGAPTPPRGSADLVRRLMQTCHKSLRRGTGGVLCSTFFQRVAGRVRRRRPIACQRPFEKYQSCGILRRLSGGGALFQSFDDLSHGHVFFSPAHPRANWGKESAGHGTGRALCPGTGRRPNHPSRFDVTFQAGFRAWSAGLCRPHVIMSPSQTFAAQWHIDRSPSLTVAGAAPESHRLPNSPPLRAAPWKVQDNSSATRINTRLRPFAGRLRTVRGRLRTECHPPPR